MQRLAGPQWATFLYNHNPFYLISAGLILYGANSAFGGESSGATDIWLLATVISSYIILLAVTAFAIVKFGKVWDDARSIFMVLLLLFFSLSVSFDSLCISSPQVGAGMLVGGFLFSWLITEVLLKSLKIKFPTLFKIPFIFMLAVSFFYPLTIAARHAYFDELDVRWLLLLFPVLCAATILSLLPAVRKNAKYVAKNGTPWSWPMFPYSVFALLIIGLCGRVVLMTMAFDPSAGTGSIFSGYFLVPICFAVLVVLLEIAKTEKSEGLKEFALLIAAPVVLLAVDWGSGFGRASFYDEVTSTVGSPLWIAIVISIVFYLVAWLRGFQSVSYFMLNCFLVAACVVRADGTLADGLVEISVWPCVCLATLQLLTPKLRESSGRWLVACGWLSPIMLRLCSQLGNQFISFGVTCYWLLFAILVIAFYFQDQFAIRLRVVAAFLMSIFAIASCAVSYGILPIELSTFVTLGILAQAPLTAIVAAAVFFLRRERVYSLVSALAAGCTVLGAMPLVSIGFDNQFSDKVWFLSIGLATFAIAVFVSSLKAGLAGRMQREFNLMIDEIKVAWGLAAGSDSATSVVEGD